MKNGNVQEFVDNLYYGDELWFIYDGKKYFLEGWASDGILQLILYEMLEGGKTYIWNGTKTEYPVDEFIIAKIWNGKSFWDVESEFEWVDC